MRDFDNRKHLIPVIDVDGLTDGTGNHSQVAVDIGHACQEYGFFYVTRHGVDERLVRQLEQVSRQFFRQDLTTKLEIEMSRGGRAWRGYFPVGGELTSGAADMKEGIYFGAELDDDHPLVKSGAPLHGRNLFPASIPQLRPVVLDYLSAMTQLGHSLMRCIALSLGLDESYFADRYTADPLILFRVFNYPAGQERALWGVGEHTDYGLLTILWQDASGGLEIKTKSGWVEATPIPGSFVCNVGDMLDRLTGGRYVSVPHRVKHQGDRDRLSFAFFFDPNFNAAVKPIDFGGPVHETKDQRWDHASVHEFQSTYGDYLLSKVSKVFPDLRRRVL